MRLSPGLISFLKDLHVPETHPQFTKESTSKFMYIF